MWSSAAVAHLLQGSTRCAFRDGIQHTLVVTNGYLSDCFLSIIWRAAWFIMEFWDVVQHPLSGWAKTYLYCIKHYKK